MGSGRKYGAEYNYGCVQEQSPVVRITGGSVRGENRDGIAVFRGIPYGARCDGERRFRPPLPADSWQGILDCTQNGPIAVQRGTSISGSEDFGAYFSGGRPEIFGCENEAQDENCLVLDVLTPGIDGGKRPVVVYFHGGGFATGSGTLVLGADGWCREEDMVVVGVNHRLNVFGYLYLGELNPAYVESGTAGMLDCVLALEWVRDNIAAFGGDPGCVTIMGESGGGGKVNCLLAMEKAKGLFKGAIVESGSMLPGMNGRKEGTALARELLKTLEIPESNTDRLQRIPAQDLLAAADAAGLNMRFAPIGDEINLPSKPVEAAWECNPDLPLLVGASREEMAGFDTPEGEYGWQQLAADLNDMPADIERLIGDFRKIGGEAANPRMIRYQIESMNGILGGGAFRQAIARAKMSRGSVYHYFVTFPAPHPRVPGFKCAWHTADLPLQMRVVTYPECESISRIMAHSWAAFIRTGSPSVPELPWPAFTETCRKTMVLDTVCRVETDPTAVYRTALAECSVSRPFRPEAM